MEMLTTFEPGDCIFNSSPTVLTSRRRGDAPGRPGIPPTSFVRGSNTLVMGWDVSRSYHSFAMMPLTDGVAPLRKVECPTADDARTVRHAARPNTAPCSRN